MAITSSGLKDKLWKSGLRLDMMLLVAGASASSQLPGLDELSDDRKKPRDEQGNCALTPRGKIYRFVGVIFEMAESVLII
jgi:hypothetical protein